MFLKCISCPQFKPYPPYRNNATKRWLCDRCKRIAQQRIRLRSVKQSRLLVITGGKKT